MTKAEMLDAVAKASGVTKGEAEKAIGAFFELVTKSARKGEKVGWPGFGSFNTSKTKARTGRNPQTGAPVKIAASTRMKFSPSSTLKTSLNAKGAAAKSTGSAAKSAGAAKATAGAAKASGAAKTAGAAKATAAASKTGAAAKATKTAAKTTKAAAKSK